MKTTSDNRFRTYRQTISATFATPSDATAATLAFRELPPGCDISLSSRWDDSNPRHLQNARAVTAAGAKATYYLNAAEAGFVASTVRPVLALGCSVGIHTCTHPFPTQLTLGGLFDEILANRIAVETAADTPVNAFTLPFGVYRSRTRPGIEYQLGESLRRTGIFGGGDDLEDPAAVYGLPHDEFVGCLHYGFDDRQPSRARFLQGVEAAEERFRTGDLPACGPHIAMGTHSWADDAGMEEITRCFEQRTRNPSAPHVGRTWFCNENEFAASWIQARHTRVASKSVDGTVATWTLERVEPAELGDNIPLFLQFGRGPVSASLPVDANGQASLPHAEGHAVPTRIDAVTNAAPGSDKFPGLSAQLVLDRTANSAHLTVRNRTGAPLDDLAVVLRLPLCWEDGLARTEPVALADGETLSLDFELSRPSDDPATREGPFLAAAQIDFLADGEPRRLYATDRTVLPVREAPDRIRDASRVATALPSLLWTDERLAALSRPGADLSELELFPSTRDPLYAPDSYHFRSDASAYRDLAARVPAELRAKRLQLVVAEFESDGASAVLSCHTASPALFLNGKKRDLADGAEVPTLPGRNRIVLTCAMDHWCPRGDLALLSSATGRPLPFRAP